jgi:hypothetical protein
MAVAAEEQTLMPAAQTVVVAEAVHLGTAQR